MADLIVGTDSYVTLIEAEAYIANFYLANDPRRQSWDALAEDDKNILLRKAAQDIDNLPLTGRKTIIKQKMAFPRDFSAVVPEEIKHSQVEQAAFLPGFAESSDVATRAALQRQGVTSYSLGDLSETYGPQSSLGINYVKYAESVLTFMAPWLSGGYRICHCSPCT